MPDPVSQDRSSWENQKHLSQASEDRRQAIEDWKAMGMIFLSVGCFVLLFLSVLAFFLGMFD
jgi:hypothetical protein